MRVTSGGLDLSATDLSNFIGCRHRTGLDMAVAEGRLKALIWVDQIAEALRERGIEHERGYTESLKNEGLQVLDLNDLETDEASTRTLDAMRSGVDVIFQAVVRSKGWLGKPDILRKVLRPSNFGNWSYEVYDTKLARETRGGTILQLALYSHLIEEAQGVLPESFYVVTPGPTFIIHPYRLDDYSAYYRLVRQQLLDTVLKPYTEVQDANYPEPVAHCDVCRWFPICDKRRRADDHLTFVAGISRSHRDELEAHDVATLAQLAALALPIPFKPARGSVATYERIRHQAALQLHRRETGQPVHDLLLPILPDRGLTRLPPPSPGDLFLDLEGAQFAREGGREYLFGLGQLVRRPGPSVRRPGPVDPASTAEWQYRAWWAYSDADEKQAFEELMDETLRAWERDPALHIYHFAHYEPTAFKRLMGRYATREVEMDRLLRAERFVDLYAVVRHALRASVESYSIKDLEIFYKFTRKVDLKQAGPERQLLERALEANAPDLISDEMKIVVTGYNEDDCRSTLELRNWLESLRSGLEKDGAEVPRPTVQDKKIQEEISDREKRALALRERLLQGVPIDEASRTPDQQARYLLAYLVDWHRRENRVTGQEYYRLRDLPEPDLIDEPKAVAGMTLVKRVGAFVSEKTGKATKSVVDRYFYPEQEMDLKEGDGLTLNDESKLGEVIAVDRIGRTLDVKKSGEGRDVHPSCAFSFTFFRTDGQQDAIMDFADQVLAGGFGGLGCREALLGRTPPALRSGPFERNSDEAPVNFAIRIATDLDHCVLPIQGPPGTGKTFTGAQMIGALVKKRLRVGVTAHSHEVIRTLLREVHKHFGKDVRLGHKPDDEELEPFIEELGNKDALQKLQDREIDVVGGTSWLWSRPEFTDAVDVLFVDEAGQMSLANVLAVARAAKSVVLLGDPQQLAQPRKGSHPEGTEASALEHILGVDQTVREERGIFLDTTWRLPPPICTFTSETFYESRLTPLKELESQRLTGPTSFAGAGLWIVPVSHEGNQNYSDNEVDVAEELVNRLLSGGSGWTNKENESAELAAKDVLIIAPYNAQVTRLQARLESRGIRVGTVDKFQGQQAPVVIYSMATSRPEDAPRGMEFLYNLNRLNVATSRAQCACILVASPALFEPECRTPRQMQLANALCRYREMAKQL